MPAGMPTRREDFTVKRLVEGMVGVVVAVVVTVLAALTAPIWILWMWINDRKRAQR